MPVRCPLSCMAQEPECSLRCRQIASIKLWALQTHAMRHSLTRLAILEQKELRKRSQNLTHVEQADLSKITNSRRVIETPPIVLCNQVIPLADLSNAHDGTQTSKGLQAFSEGATICPDHHGTSSQKDARPTRESMQMPVLVVSFPHPPN